MDKAKHAVENDTGNKTANKAEYCKKCGKQLTGDEIGATKKLVNRGSTVFYCIDCLAEGFDVTRQDIEKKIVYFKEMGCTCFLQEPQTEK